MVGACFLFIFIVLGEAPAIAVGPSFSLSNSCSLALSGGTEASDCHLGLRSLSNQRRLLKDPAHGETPRRSGYGEQHAKMSARSKLLKTQRDVMSYGPLPSSHPFILIDLFGQNRNHGRARSF